MDTTHLPPDFREFLRWLKHHEVEYLLVGGYAVGYHGYPRATMDMDIWVARSPGNARKVRAALDSFGFGSATVTEELLLSEDTLIRMGLPPVRIEIMTAIDGVAFSEAYEQRIRDTLDEVPVDIIGLDHLKQNKKAAARPKDLADLEELG